MLGGGLHWSVQVTATAKITDVIRFNAAIGWQIYGNELQLAYFALGLCVGNYGIASINGTRRTHDDECRCGCFGYMPT